MKIIIAALLCASAFAQVAEKTGPPVVDAKPPAFTHEQKDALKDAAIQSLVAEKQVASAQKAADAANSAYINLLNQALAKIGCVGGQVDLSFAVSCPPK